MEMLVLEKAQWAAISFRSGKSSGGAMLVHKKISIYGLGQCFWNYPSEATLSTVFK